MEIVVHSRSNPAGHIDGWADAFIQGLEAHNVEFSVSHSRPTKAVPGLIVTWGARRAEAIKNRSGPSCRYLVMERGYFGDRFENTSLGFDGLNRRADFLNKDSSPDRWIKHGVGLIKPWNPGSEYILIMGQVPNDFAVSPHINFSEWLHNTVKSLRRTTQLPIVFRPHPRRPRRWEIEGAEILDPEGDLKSQLRKAACVVTFNSNTGVDAVLEGIPTITMDEGAMAWEVTGHALESALDPVTPSRLQWAYDLAYCQWTKEEIEEGLAWEHLRRGVEM